MKEKWIDNKTIIVTGASSGIGKSLCRLLVQKYNCRVIGVARSEEKCATLKEELGEKFDYRLFDVGEKNNWQNFAEELKKEGTMPDLLINNAGMLPPFCVFRKTDPAQFERVIHTNFLSVVYACYALLPLLTQSEQGGVVNISSSSALCTLPGVTAYASSKAAVKNFTESLASEYAKKDFYVGLVLPGFTMTDIFREQKSGKADGLIATVATPCEKMVKKIERAIVRKKRRCVFGVDAHGMNLLYRLFPSAAASVCGSVLRLFHLDLFSDVFDP